jgi:hypothetical protein
MGEYGERIEMINSHSIDPPHGINDDEKFEALKASMAEGGWVGRPLLVLPQGDGYRALTGSHRWQAAYDNDMDIPCVVIDEDAWYAVTDEVLFDREGLWVLDEIGDETAAALAIQEDN